MVQKTVICLLALGVGILFPPSRAGAWSAGPGFAHFPLTLTEGTRTEILGPLFQSEQRDEFRQWAVPPVCSAGRTTEADRVDFDLLYPVLTYDRIGSESRWQILQLFSWAGGEDQAGAATRRFTLFPLYFQQRGDQPEENYTALFPLYGQLRNRFFRDEIRFVLFPAYSQTRKQEVVTHNYLYPLFHRREGEGLRGWQCWPLYGTEYKTTTVRTNTWDDVETLPGHEKRFVLWPLYLEQWLRLGTEQPEHHQALLPFYSYTRSPQRDSTTYLWPLGLTLTEDRERHYREVGAPWPFIVFARRPGKTTSRVWPLFGHAANAHLQSDFYLWPVYKYNRLQSAPLDRERTRLLFFLYSRVNEHHTETQARRQSTDLWPLFTHRRDFEGNTRVQWLAPLEPLVPNNKSIERNWSPLWSLWRAERNAKTGAASQSLLWNLYRQETTPETRKRSFLFGLVQHEFDSHGRRCRLFYLPLGRRPASADYVSGHR
ncbi:MAG TPA: hypothetical protein PLT00_02360 [Verrucomicrobiota bacterium]|nr:hypothetical protein [Verrucomicrobiota bacterium]HQB15537.1 hypothetical protein [Verrucomicrobiota bacterium]